MPGDLKPEAVQVELQKGRLRPVYLFYGPGEFRLERLLGQIKMAVVPDAGTRDFNLHVFYADEDDATPGRVLDTARSYPFMADKRLVIVKRTEAYTAADLEEFPPYFEDPMPSTCLVFVSSKTNFNMVFYKTLRRLGCAVEFKDLQEREVPGWIRTLAKELGLVLTDEACAFLQQFVGTSLRELHGEMEKLALMKQGQGTVGIEDLTGLVIHSRTYNIFELMDSVSQRRTADALSIMRRLLLEERDVSLRIVGMLNRQVRLLWQAKGVVQGGGTAAEVARRLRIPPFPAKKLMGQVKFWRVEDLQQALELIYHADGLAKTGAPAELVFETLIIGLCRTAGSGGRHPIQPTG